MPYYSNGRNIQYVPDYTMADAVGDFAGVLSQNKKDRLQQDEATAKRLLEVLKAQNVNAAQYREIRSKVSPTVQRYLPELPDWQESDADAVGRLGMAGARKRLEGGEVGENFYESGAFETAFGKQLPAAAMPAEGANNAANRGARQPSLNALTGERKARTTEVQERTTNIRQRRDPNSPLTLRDIKVKEAGTTPPKPRPSSAEVAVAELEKRAGTLEDRAAGSFDPVLQKSLRDQAAALREKVRGIKRAARNSGVMQDFVRGAERQRVSENPADVEYADPKEWQALLDDGETEESLNAQGIYLKE